MYREVRSLLVQMGLVVGHLESASLGSEAKSVYDVGIRDKGTLMVTEDDLQPCLTLTGEGQLLVDTFRYGTSPAILGLGLIHLEANQRLNPHNADFLTNRSNGVGRLTIVTIGERYDRWATVIDLGSGAGDPSYERMGEQLLNTSRVKYENFSHGGACFLSRKSSVARDTSLR